MILAQGGIHRPLDIDHISTIRALEIRNVPVIAVQGEDVCQYRFSTIGKTEGRWPTHGIDKSRFAVISAEMIYCSR